MTSQEKAVKVTPNFMPKFAVQLHKCMDEMPLDWWSAVTPSSVLRDTPGFAEMIREQRAEAEKKAAEGSFSYVFRRTVDDHHACTCEICQCYRLFRSPSMVNRIATLTGIPVTKAGALFASYYAPNDFLGMHTDINNGAVSFVWNLTKSWVPQFGGCLTSFDNSWSQGNVYVPGFDELVTFDVRGEGYPHLVSRVIPGVKEKRLAFSGWYEI